ncbi:MAG TPA: hypothetical protein VI431_12420 [Candidatus Acidoferrum sp.]
MIGVIADAADQDVVREFFELFKTPWEFCRKNQRYDVLLCAGGDVPLGASAKLTLWYAGRKNRFDDKNEIHVGDQRSHASTLMYLGQRIPIYGETITFAEESRGLLRDESSNACVIYVDKNSEGVFVRIGYSLLSEIRQLLVQGQPSSNAAIPTLELHIALLRDLITNYGVPLIEIPPVPEGYRFIACLTHDVDHPFIRHHRWDHTVFGFLYRAAFVSLWKFFQGQMPIGDVLRNWAAITKLPFVYLGFAKDFWREFSDRYLQIEKGIHSTFFIIPFRDCSGKTSAGLAPSFRAARYEAKDLINTIQKLVDAGCEVGLHGIDAWLDPSEGKKELEEIRRLTGVKEIGVRMHWLYFNKKSPIVLEEAGAAYDSTIGYNETVGYRTGTTQVYKPLDVSRILELPMHIMDTALFYPDHLGLSAEGARALFDCLAENAVKFGGCLSINWHDRSIAPERLWGACYRDFVDELKARGAWFATAGEAVSWFRRRRSVEFEKDPECPTSMRAKIPSNVSCELPGLRMRIHREQNVGESQTCTPEAYVDVVITKGTESQSVVSQ